MQMHYKLCKSRQGKIIQNCVKLCNSLKKICNIIQNILKTKLYNWESTGNEPQQLENYQESTEHLPGKCWELTLKV